LEQNGATTQRHRRTDLVQELARAVAVPDVDVLGLQRLGGGVARQEPQQLLRHAAPKNLLGGQQRQCVVAQGVAHLDAKLGHGARAGAVVPHHARRNDVADGVQVLVLLVPPARRQRHRQPQ